MITLKKDNKLNKFLKWFWGFDTMPTHIAHYIASWLFMIPFSVLILTVRLNTAICSWLINLFFFWKNEVDGVDSSDMDFTSQFFLYVAGVLVNLLLLVVFTDPKDGISLLVFAGTIPITLMGCLSVTIFKRKSKETDYENIKPKKKVNKINWI